MTFSLADDYVADVRARLGVPADAMPRAIACALWGARPCVVVDGPTQLVDTAAGTCLQQSSDAPPHARHWALARALAAYQMSLDRVAHPVALVASSMLLPRALMAAARDEAAESIASRYVAPLGAVMLRVADLERRPTALVLRHWSRVRGDDRGALPTDHAKLRELAFGRVGLLGIRKTKTPDGEVVLRVA